MNLAHATHVFLNNHTRLPKLYGMLGRVKRRGKLGSSVIANRLEMRTSVFLCKACENKMPAQWLRQYEYRVIENMHAANTRCDACQNMDSTNVFVAEDGGYYQQQQRLDGITKRSRDQQLTIRDGRRIKGR